MSMECEGTFKLLPRIRKDEDLLYARYFIIISVL